MATRNTIKITVDDSDVGPAISRAGRLLQLYERMNTLHKRLHWRLGVLCFIFGSFFGALCALLATRV